MQSVDIELDARPLIEIQNRGFGLEIEWLGSHNKYNTLKIKRFSRASTIIQPQLTSVLWTDRRAHAEQNLRGPSAVFCKSRIRNLLFLATEADSERAAVPPFLGTDAAAGPTTVRPKNENMRESSACLVLRRGKVCYRSDRGNYAKGLRISQ